MGSVGGVEATGFLAQGLGHEQVIEEIWRSLRARGAKRSSPTYSAVRVAALRCPVIW